MIYEAEPEHESELEINVSSWQSNAGFVTAQSYLKGLHWNDRPSSLMPKDAVILSKARRFYESLSEKDQAVIDSFSDPSFFEAMNVKQRNKRFNELCFMFMRLLGYITLSTPTGETKGRVLNGKSD